MGSPPPGAFLGGQVGVQIFNGVEISVQPWNSGNCNCAIAPLLAPDTGVGEAPQNDATVENNSTPPSIEAGGANYSQPNVDNPLDSPQVDASTMGAVPVNQIEVVEGENVQQPDTANPAPNPQVTVGGSVNLNPMSL